MKFRVVIALSLLFCLLACNKGPSYHKLPEVKFGLEGGTYSIDLDDEGGRINYILDKKNKIRYKPSTSSERYNMSVPGMKINLDGLRMTIQVEAGTTPCSWEASVFACCDYYTIPISQK